MKCLPLLAGSAILLALAAGCKNDSDAKSATSTTTPATSDTPPATSNPTPAPTGPVMGPPAAAPVDVTSVPDTTVIEGKTVKLTTLPSGVKYYDIKVGTGAVAKSGQRASMQYTGTLLDGSKFDSSYDHGGTPFDFTIGGGEVIKGWDEGIPSMKVGGKRRLIVPGSLAYGEQSPTPAIPPNATLVFDVELVAVN